MTIILLSLRSIFPPVTEAALVLITRQGTVKGAMAGFAVALLAALGLGAGDSALYGLGLKPQKVGELEEAIDFFRAVFSGEEGALDGKKYNLPHAAATIPIYLAVSQQRMCELAGRKADGAIVMGPAQPDMVRQQVAWIEAGLGAAGACRLPRAELRRSSRDTHRGCHGASTRRPTSRSTSCSRGSISCGCAVATPSLARRPQRATASAPVPSTWRSA